MKTFLKSIQDRRSIYALSNASPISDARIEKLVGEAVKNVPSAFNMQDQRAVLLFGKDHDKLWSIVLETLRKIVPAASFGKTEAKIKGYAAGHGTVLYFSDNSIVEGMAKEFPLYAEKFREWAPHGAGMLQFAVWNLLESEGLGASLQHYNPLIDEEVKKTWKLPADWKLIAQMPFGTPTALPEAKEFDPLEKRFYVFGK